MIELLEFLFLDPWRALAELAGIALAAAAGVVAVGWGVAWWMQVDDPDREAQR